MAIGLARVVGKGARATTWALAAFGAGVAVAAIFRADPVDGFPAGTPLGPPTDISTMGLMHFPVSALAFTCFGVSALLAAPVLARRGELSMSRLSLASGQGSGTAAWVEMRLGVLVFAGLCMWMGVSIIRSGAASGRSLERLEPRGPRHDTWELMTLQH